MKQDEAAVTSVAYPDESSRIEARTKEQVINLLKSAGLGKVRRRKMQDYELAKRLVFKDNFIQPAIYDRQIGWICEYLGI